MVHRKFEPSEALLSDFATLEYRSPAPPGPTHRLLKEMRHGTMSFLVKLVAMVGL